MHVSASTFVCTDVSRRLGSSARAYIVSLIAVMADHARSRSPNGRHMTVRWRGHYVGPRGGVWHLGALSTTVEMYGGQPFLYVNEYWNRVVDPCS